MQKDKTRYKRLGLLLQGKRVDFAYYTAPYIKDG
jgi:hypothetical protein